MSRSLLLALIVLVAAPLALLAWASASVLREQQSLAQQRLHGLLTSRLREWDLALSNQMDRYARDLRQQFSQPAANRFEALRDIQREEPIVRRAFWISGNGLILFPSKPTSDFADNITFYAALSGLVEARPSAGGGEQAKGAPTLPPSWQRWYMDEGMQLVYWVPQADGSSIGVLLERSRWMADLTAALPDGGDTTAGAPGVTVLVDESAQPVYLWGTGEPSKGTPLAATSLSPPLSNWSLEFHSDQPLIAPSSDSALVWALSAVAVVLVSLGGYVVTGVRRQMRDAQRRVSFAGQVSHELRTPLTNIRLYAELAEADLGGLTDSQARDAIAGRLQVIDQESHRLSRLVSGVLEMIRNDRKPRPPRMSVVSADEVIDRTLLQFGPSFEKLGLHVDRVSEAGRSVRLDPDILEVVLVNLLSNVEKYAAEGHRVTVQSRLQGGKLLVSVADHGPGIPRRHRRSVFQAFSRVDDSIHSPSGTGIGLAIARRSARRHGGDLTLVPSETGCHFLLCLPVDEADSRSTPGGFPTDVA